MSYIIVVNPSMLSTPGTGMSYTGVLTATVLISFLATFLMGAFAKLPFALAPGMGLNAFFTFSIILGQKVPWQTALGMVFWAGIVFTLISLTPLRAKIIDSIPNHLRHAMAVGIGLFLCFIGLQGAQIIVKDPVTFVKAGKVSFELVMAILGLFLMIFFIRKKNPASFLLGMGFVTIVSVIYGKVQLPKSFFSYPDFKSVMFQVDFLGGLTWALIPSTITLIFTDFIDTMSTFIGLSHNAGLLDKEGNPKNIKQAFIVDSIATTCSAFLGTSPTTTYIESSAGIEMGGRSGFTSIVTSLCFLPFLFLAPLVGLVPKYATAPVLIIVGLMMFKSIKHISFDKYEDAIPCFLTMIIIPLSFSITEGIVWGFFTFNILYLISGRVKDLKPTMMVLGLFSAAIIFLS